MVLDPNCSGLFDRMTQYTYFPRAGPSLLRLTPFQEKPDVAGESAACRQISEERQRVTGGQMVYIPPGVLHQLTNVGETPLRMIYCYGPAGDVAHWRQELDGTLPRAGIEAPPLPEGAAPQCTDKPEA